MSMTRQQLIDRITELEREVAELRGTTRQLEPHEPDITIPELADMDGAGGFASAFMLYPVPVSKQQELEAAIKIANNGPQFSGSRRIRENVQLSDFNYTAYEEHHKGLADSGSPQFLAFRHKRTGKSQAGFAYYDPGGGPKHLPTAVVLGQLAMPGTPA